MPENLSSAQTPVDTLGDEAGGELDWRILRLLNIYRVMTALVLLIIFLVSPAPRVVGNLYPAVFLTATLIYFFFALVTTTLVAKRIPDSSIQVFGHLVGDIVAVVSLLHASGGIQSGLGSLLFIPIGAASLVLQTRIAILFAAIASLGLLFQHFLAQLSISTNLADYTQTGLSGLVLFFLAGAGSWLGKRVRDSEALAESRGVDLANLAQLNAHIVQRLRESIVVVDTNETVRLMNTSAAQYLGTDGDVTGQPLKSLAPELYRKWQTWLRNDENSLQQSTIISADKSSMVIPHFTALGDEDRIATLIFMEDTSLLAERVQQSKLASLGRLSASIAHEIRNPVGAISHAGQLLAESKSIGPGEKRLTEIIQAHSERVSTIIDNVLQLSRRDSTRPERIVLPSWLGSFMDEFLNTEQFSINQVAISHPDPNLQVLMDPSHLHQVLWNLCSNALKYGLSESSSEQAVIDLSSGRVAVSGRPFLEVADRGPGISDDLVDRVFEPFFTAGAEGTGLGLFIARELCETNRARLIYNPREGGGSTFRIIFADPTRWEVSTHE